MSYQQVIVVGNVGRDPEFNYTPNGSASANFSIATNEKWTDRQTNELKEKTTWFRVRVYGPQAETVKQYVSKGRQVMVIGTIDVSAYMDKSGQPAASLELRARDVRFLGGRNEGGGAQGDGGEDYAPSYGNNGGRGQQTTDDVPF